MSRPRTVVGAISATAAMTAMMILGATGSAGASPRPAETHLAGSAVPFASSAHATGSVAASQKLSIQVWLRPRLAAAQSFATAVSTPGNSQFHHYLSPNAYTARFGAASSEAASVEKWLRSQGFTDIHADSQRSYVRATGATSKINKAFRVQLKYYQATATANAGP